MPLSKAKDKERKRRGRALSNLNRNPVQPNNENIRMAKQMLPIQMKAYAIADEVRRLYSNGRLPNCPDGRYR